MIAGRSEVIANARCGFGLIREGSAQLSWRQLRFTSPCSWRPRCVERRATNGRTRERKQQYLRGSCSPCFWVSPAPAFTSGAPRLGGSTQRATRRTTCLPISPFQKMGRPLLVVLSGACGLTVQRGRRIGHGPLQLLALTVAVSRSVSWPARFSPTASRCGRLHGWPQ